MAKTKASQNVDFQAERSKNMQPPFNRFVGFKPYSRKVVYTYYKPFVEEEDSDDNKDENEEGGGGAPMITLQS